MLLIAGFNHADPSQTGWSHSGGTASERSSTIKRTGSYSMRVSTSNSNRIAHALAANYVTLYMGVAFYTASLTGSYARQRLCSFLDSSSTQITITLENTGAIRIWRGLAGGFDGIGAATSLATSASSLVTASAWNHLIVIVTFNGTTGSVECRLNSTPLVPNVIASFTGNTITSANAYANVVGLGDVIPNGIQNFDDFWTSDVGNQGDCAIETLYPTSNGSVNNFNVVGAASNYLAVLDAASPDDDTTYTYDSNIGDFDLYTMGNTSYTTGTIKGFQASIRVRKDDAGGRNAAMVLRQGSTNSVRTNTALSSSYAYITESFTVDPVLGTAPTIASINSLELGATVLS